MILEIQRLYAKEFTRALEIYHEAFTQALLGGFMIEEEEEKTVKKALRLSEQIVNEHKAKSQANFDRASAEANRIVSQGQYMSDQRQAHGANQDPRRRPSFLNDPRFWMSLGHLASLASTKEFTDLCRERGLPPESIQAAFTFMETWARD